MLNKVKKSWVFNEDDVPPLQYLHLGCQYNSRYNGAYKPQRCEQVVNRTLVKSSFKTSSTYFAINIVLVYIFIWISYIFLEKQLPCVSLSKTRKCVFWRHFLCDAIVFGRTTSARATSPIYFLFLLQWYE